MKKLLVLIALAGLMLQVNAQKQSYSYSFTIKGSQDTVAYLASYYGDKLFYNDTALVDKKGRFVFEGKGEKPGGIYAFVLPSQKYFEFLIAEPNFSLETDTADFIENMRVKGSAENEIFFKQMQMVGALNNQVQPLMAERDSLSKLDDKSPRLDEIKDIMLSFDEKVKSSRLKVYTDYGHLYVSQVFAATEDPIIPDDLGEELEGKEKDKVRFDYFKAHFFDRIDFSDERVMRMPAFHKKMVRYLEKMTAQTPDSVIVSAKEIVDMSKADTEVFRYVLNYITSHYESSKIMGMDAVFVAMVECYYATGDATWLKGEKLEKLVETSDKLKPTLIGKRAPFLRMQDTSGTWSSLYDIESPITVLFIWDPDCGNCKKAMPKLEEFYQNYKDKGVELYAVSTDFENDKWISFLKKNPKMSWINVSDSPQHPNAFRDVYDVFSTPRLFVLDKNKIIKAKRLGVEQLPDFVDFLLKENNKDK